MRILSTLNRELLKPSASIALHRHSNALVDILPPEADSSISLLSQSDRPDVSYSVSLVLPLSTAHSWVQPKMASSHGSQSDPPAVHSVSWSPSLSMVAQRSKGATTQCLPPKAASVTARCDTAW